MMIRVINDNLGRAIHAPLYYRLLNFFTQYTPELPGEPVIQLWLERIYKNDKLFHVLVELNDVYDIVCHAVIEVQSIYDTTVVHCYQVQNDNKNVSNLDELSEYIDKLASTYNASYTVMYVTKNTKVLEKKYGYKVSRIAMIKTLGDNSITKDEQYG